jgi:REP element-mobilizing transposase RayT
MPRPPRVHYPGAVYHVMARGVDGREIFADDLDRRNFMGTVLRLKTETPYSILAYCLMGNHFHFAIKVGASPLSQIMQRLLTSYVIGFNGRHSREGHLFQARYKSFLCLDNSYLIALVRYIHRNPVRAGLVASPGDWPWSSHQLYAKRTPAPLADTSLFFSIAEDQEYSPSNVHDSFNPWPESERHSVLLRKDSEERKTLDDLASDIFPDDIMALRSGERTRALSKKKSILAARAVQNGYSLSTIATWMGCTPSAVHHLIRRNK